MSEVHERLSYYIDYKGYNLSEFCKKFGFVYNTFTQIASGSRPLGIQILNKIASALPELNLDWLLNGRGIMEYGDDYRLPQTNEPIPIYGEDPFTKTLLTYLDMPAVKNKIQEILNDGKKGK